MPVRFKTLSPARITAPFSTIPIFTPFLNVSNITFASRSAATFPGRRIVKGFSALPGCNVPEAVPTGSIPEVISATNPPPTVLSFDANARIDMGAETDPPFEM